MKSSVTQTTVFKYILVFTFLFAAFLALAITYNRIYKLKNETISIIEKYEGVVRGKKALQIINNYLYNSGYNTQGYCEIGEYGVKDLNNPDYEEVTNRNQDYYYCLSYYCKPDEKCRIGGINNLDAPNGNEIYYNVKLFFKFNIPFIGDLLTFKITGETKGIKYYSNNQKLS